MQEFLKELFFAVITAAVPVLTAYIVVLIRKVGENAAANTESIQAKTYIMEAAEAIALLAGDRELRRTYSRRLRAVVDGRGAMRIARRIIQKSQEGAQSASQSAWQIAD